jgi:hypothetical protein
MHANPRAASGTRSLRASSKRAVIHQHGSWATPVSRSISIAHAFAVPQSGQRVGSMVGRLGMVHCRLHHVPIQRGASSFKKAKYEGIGLVSGST